MNEEKKLKHVVRKLAEYLRHVLERTIGELMARKVRLERMRGSI
jgi:hypothetical protein